MTRTQLVERFCEALDNAKLGPFETTVYSESVFIDWADDDEIEALIRELEKLA